MDPILLRFTIALDMARKKTAKRKWDLCLCDGYK